MRDDDVVEDLIEVFADDAEADDDFVSNDADLVLLVAVLDLVPLVLVCVVDVPLVLTWLFSDSVERCDSFRLEW